MKRALLAVLAAVVAVLGLTAPSASAATASAPDSAFTYTGSWTSDSGEHYSSSAGDSAVINFTAGAGGSTFSLRANTLDTNNTVSVSIDGGSPVNVNEHSSSFVTDTTVYTSPAQAAGGHTATVTVVNPYGSITGADLSDGTFGGAGYQPGNTTPTAAFTGTTLTAHFDASASTDPDGSVSSYAWDFGDGHTGSGVTVSHTYAAAGTYTATLTVTDNAGGATTTSHDVTVGSVSASTAGSQSGGQQDTTASATLTPGDGTIGVDWSLAVGADGANGAILSRDGTDATGEGPWSSPVQAGTSGSFTFSQLVNGTSYNITVQPTADGVPVGQPFTAAATPATGGGGTGGGSTGAAAHGPSGTWTQVWGDEFDGTSLDTSKWSPMDGGNMNNVTTLASNISEGGGLLTLQLSDSGHGAEVSSSPGDGAGANGYLLQVGDYVEASVKFPGDGSSLYNWPAWWASGPNWPAAGEHDIAEVLSGDLTVNYHSPSGAHNGPAPSGYWGDQFHTYGLYRAADHADVYWDGQLVYSYSTDDNGAAESILANVGTSGSVVTGSAGAIQLDYVRVFRQG